MLLALALPAQALAATCVYASHGSRTSRQIALTFDDGTSAVNCQKVVNVLKATNTPATFFPNAVWVAKAPAFWRSVAKSYPIGNHTYDHKSLPSLSYAAQVSELTRDEATVEKVTGVAMIKVARPPYGA